jgi:Mg-chelatase subunit ChlD
METLRGATVEGINLLLRGLAPADRVTVVQFDSEDPYEVLVHGVPAAEVAPVTVDQYQPRGGTPLFDAVGRAIADTAGRAREVEILTGVRPSVTLAILTDGFENASCEYTGPQVARLVERSRADGWDITYLGLGLGDDAYREAATIGLRSEDVVLCEDSDQGVAEAFTTTLSRVEASRSRATGEPSEP